MAKAWLLTYGCWWKNKRLDAGCREVKEGWKSLPKQFLFLPSVIGLHPLGLLPHSYTCASSQTLAILNCRSVCTLVKGLNRSLFALIAQKYTVKWHTPERTTLCKSAVFNCIIQLPLIQKQSVATKAFKTGNRIESVRNFAFCRHAHIFSIHYD